MVMKPKLREIHIGRRKSSVTRRQVVAAIKAVRAAQNAEAPGSVDCQPEQKPVNRPRK